VLSGAGTAGDAHVCGRFWFCPGAVAVACCEPLTDGRSWPEPTASALGVVSAEMVESPPVNVVPKPEMLRASPCALSWNEPGPDAAALALAAIPPRDAAASKLAATAVIVPRIRDLMVSPRAEKAGECDN
jgi:hypothetical protein